MKVPPKNLLIFFFLVILVLTCVIGVYSFNNNRTFNDTSRWLKHSYTVLEKNDDIYALTMTIEGGSNNYLFAHDSNSLLAYRQAAGSITSEIDTLKKLTKDNPLQKFRIELLSKFIHQQVQFSDSCIQLQNEREFDKSEQSRYIQQNRFYTDKINDLLSEILHTETILLNQREAANNRSIKIFHWVFYSILSCLFVLVIAVIYLIVNEFKREAREKAITEKALTHEKELNEMKSSFVSFASHEFRTPLATILSSVSLIEKYQEGKMEAMSVKHISRIKANVHSLIELLNDFLSLGKLEEGKIDHQPHNLNIAEFSNEFVAGMSELTKPGQQIIYQFKGDGAEMVVDERLLRNVLNNLLSNAIKYSPINSKIYYNVSVTDHSVQFTVKDEGIGIPEKDQKRLFETFYRASNATQTPGTGLGLCIVKRYLDIMGGNLEFTSKENQGSTFTVHLPK